MTTTAQRSVVALVMAVVLIGITGCSLSPNRLPSVRAGVSTDYRVTAQFTSVLNLPAGADVMMNGIRVGRVDRIDEAADHVDVVVGLSNQTPVPANVSAIIRQNTLLGDTYLALLPSDSAGTAALRSGDVIPLARTTSPPTLEDTIAVLAYFVNGGSIQKAQDTMATLNRTMPALTDIRRMASTVATDLDDLASNTQQIDRLLAGLDATSMSFVRSAPAIAGVFGPQAADYWNRVAVSVVAHISTLLPSVGSIFVGGLWLIPMLRSVATTAEAGRGMWDQAPSTAMTIDKFLQNTVIPFAQQPSVNVTSVESANGRQLLGDSKTLLRMLGAIR